jgi:hypothetical protein
MTKPQYTRRKYSTPNDYRIEADGVYIALTDPQGEVTGEAIIDHADLPLVLDYGRWHRQVVRTKNRVFEYVACYVRKDHPDYQKRNQRQFLHRLVLNAAPQEQVDHWDGNCLDCRKSNLRIVMPSENSLNRHFHRRIAFLEAEIARLQAELGERVA